MNNSKILILKLIKIVFYFSLNIETGIICEILELSEPTVNKIILKIQKEISRSKNLVYLGSEDLIVQIDECCFGRRKYNLCEL